MLAQLTKEYPQDVRVVFRYFPISSHDKAVIAAQAAEAAGLQKKFWEMHNLLFAKQQDWAGQTPDQFETWVIQQAAGLGLDEKKFAADLKSETVAAKIKNAQQEAERIGLPGTPFVLINGKIYQGPRDLQSLDAIVKLTSLQERQFTECPPMSIDPHKQYLATLETDKGDVVLQLYPDKAPMAVNSFVFLARHGWFDGVPFHRVLPGFVAQTGDPSGTGYGGPGYAFSNEIDPSLKFDREGVVGMANAGADSNGSQFFITYGPAPDLNGKYTIFGQVVQGMDVLQKLTPRNPDQGGELPPGDKILKVTIAEK